MVANLEIKAMLDVSTEKPTQDLRNRAIIYCLCLGLRAHELTSLNISDVMISESDSFLRVDGKGNKQREIPIPERMINPLTEWIAVLIEASPYCVNTQAFAVRTKRNGSLLHGNRLSYTGLRWIVTEIQKRANILDLFCLHSLRRTFISNIIEVADLVTARDLAGHEDVRHTAMYDRRPEARQRQAVEDWFSEW